MLRSILLTVPNITPNVDGVKGYSKSNSNKEKGILRSENTAHFNGDCKKKRNVKGLIHMLAPHQPVRYFLLQFSLLHELYWLRKDDFPSLTDKLVNNSKDKVAMSSQEALLI